MCRDRGQPAFGRRLRSLHQIVAWGNADEEKRKQMVGTALSGIFQPGRMHGGRAAPARPRGRIGSEKAAPDDLALGQVPRHFCPRCFKPGADRAFLILLIQTRKIGCGAP